MFKDNQKELISQQASTLEYQSEVIKEQRTVIKDKESEVQRLTAEVAQLNEKLSLADSRIDTLRSAFTTLGFKPEVIERAAEDVFGQKSFQFVATLLKEGTYDAAYSQNMHDKLNCPGHYESKQSKEVFAYQRYYSAGLAPFLESHINIAQSAEKLD